MRVSALAISALVAHSLAIGVDGSVAIGGDASPAIAAPIAQQRPGFSASVNRVRVNVIVTDDEGRFVDDLRAEDFRVYEDGELREVLEVQLVDVAAGKVTSLQTVVVAGEADVSAPAGKVAGAGASPTAAGSTDLAGERFGAIVYFIDSTGLDNVTKLHFTQRWASYLETQEAVNVPTAVYLVDQVGVLREIAPLTTDIDELRAAQQAVSGMPITVPGGNGLPGIAAPPGEQPSDFSESFARQDNFQQYDRAYYTFSLLAQFCDSLAARRGRTALVWVSRGVTLRGTFQDRGYEPNSTLIRMQRELHEAANSANVSIYGVDPSRLIDLVGGDASGTRAGSGRDELGNTLRAAAADTGGRHFIAWADFGEVVAEIENDSSRYYLLTYPASDQRGDDEYHEIRVEVTRPDVSVRANEGYTDRSEEERRRRFISAALALPGTVNDIPVSVSVFRGPADGDRTEVTVAVTVDGATLGIQSDDDDKPMQRIEVHGALLDRNDDMEIVEEMSRQVTEHIDEGTGAINDWLSSRQEWNLRAGSYDLRIMALDTATGGVGAAQVPVEIPEFDDDEWAVGDLLFLETRPDDTSIPVVGGRVRADSAVVGVVEVRNGVDPAVSGWVRRTGEAAGQGTPLRVSSLVEEDGLHRGTVSLPSLVPGQYVVELHVTDAAAERRHVVEVPIEVEDRGAARTRREEPLLCIAC